MDDSRFMTVPEVAAFLRISRGRAYAMANDGSLPGVVRIGPRSIRVDRERMLQGLAESSDNPYPSEVDTHEEL